MEPFRTPFKETSGNNHLVITDEHFANSRILVANTPTPFLKQKYGSSRIQGEKQQPSAQKATKQPTNRRVPNTPSGNLNLDHQTPHSRKVAKTLQI